MTSKAQSSIVKFYHSHEERVCFTMTSKKHDDKNIIVQRAFASRSQTQGREVSIGKHAHSIKRLQQRVLLNELLTESNEGQEKLLREVDSTELFRSQSNEFQDAHSIKRSQRKNDHSKKLLTPSDEGQERLLQEIDSTEAELSNASLEKSQINAENKKLREENEALRKTLEELNKAKSDLSASLLSAQKEIETLRVKDPEVEQLKKEIEQLKKENEELRKLEENDVAITERQSNLIKNFEREENQALEKNTPTQVSQ